jgi:hypothetical protein
MASAVIPVAEMLAADVLLKAHVNALSALFYPRSGHFRCPKYRFGSRLFTPDATLLTSFATH